MRIGFDTHRNEMSLGVSYLFDEAGGPILTISFGYWSIYVSR